MMIPSTKQGCADFMVVDWYGLSWGGPSEATTKYNLKTFAAFNV